MNIRTLFCLAFSVLVPAYVGATPPSCYPGESSASTALPIFVTDTQQNCAAVWFCDVGHKWERVAVVGHGDNLDNCSYPYAKAIAALILTHAKKDELWNERFVTGAETDPVKQAQYKAQDAPAFALAKTVPLPTAPPPSGLVTTSTKTYARSSSTDFNVMSTTPYAIPLGKSCDVTQSVTIGPKRYFVVRRADVCAGVANCKAPLTTFGICE